MVTEYDHDEMESEPAEVQWVGTTKLVRSNITKETRDDGDGGTRDVWVSHLQIVTEDEGTDV